MNELKSPSGTKHVASEEVFTRIDDIETTLHVMRCLLYGEHEKQLQRIEDKLDRDIWKLSVAIGALAQISYMNYGTAGSSAANVAYQAMKEIGEWRGD